MKGTIIRFALAIMLVFGLSEFAARLWLSTHPGSTKTIQQEPPILVQPIIRPLAYEHSDYWSVDFVHERYAAEESFDFSVNGFWEGHFHGKWFNFDNGFRRTTDQPDRAEHTVFMLGNSVLEGLSVPDNDTIASQLQKLFNKNYGKSYRIINAAASAMTASLELAKLKNLPLKSGDLVIFYDGIIDAEDMGANQVDVRRSYSLLGKACNWFERTVSSLALGQIYCLLINQTLLPRGQAPHDSAIAYQDSQNYLATIKAADSYTRNHGAHFYHFLQPHLLSQPPQPYEQDILDDPALANVDAVNAIKLAWPMFQQAQNSLVKDGISSWDFTHVLDSARSNGQKVYLDLIHVTDSANLILANAIFDMINVTHFDLM